MADFTTKSVTKSAERKLAAPIGTVSDFLALVQDITENNPWGCTSYTSNGATVAGVVRGTEHYSGKIVYENAEAKTVGQISVRAPTSANLRVSGSSRRMYGFEGNRVLTRLVFRTDVARL